MFVPINPYALNREQKEKDHENTDDVEFSLPVRFFIGLCQLIYAFILFGFIGLLTWFFWFF